MLLFGVAIISAIAFGIIVSIIFVKSRGAQTRNQAYAQNQPAGNPPLTHNPAPIVKWSLGFPTSPVWHWLLFGLLLTLFLFIATKLEVWAYVPNLPSLPMIIWMVVVIVVLLSLWKIVRSYGLPKGDILTGQILIHALVFALVLYAMYGVSPKAKLFTEVEGWATIAVYVVAMTAGALVSKYLKKGAWVSAMVGLFIFFTLTGARSWMLLNSDGVFDQRTHVTQLFAKFSGSGGSGSLSGTSPKCSGEPTTYGYTSAIYNINEYACQLRGRVLEGCVTWLDFNNQIRGYSCQGGSVPPVPGISRLKPDGYAVVTLNYCKPFAPGNLLERCE